ncbi:hypothetical protein KCU74_g7476, partial [Aureobasidium melanogenum]
MMRYATTLLLLAFAVHTSFAQYSRGTRVEVNDGIRTAWWSEKAGAKSTSIVTLDPAPTLWYNCRYGKSICNNVEKTQPGANAGTLQMELVYDTDTNRADARRTGKKDIPGSGMCPGSWKNRHTCPEPDQPEIWVSDISRDRADDDDKPYLKLPNSLKYPSGKQQLLNKQKKPIAKTNYQIADFNGRPSGLMYTCDEFPFASTIQGGSGLPGDANAGLSFASTTYCAPQSSSCARNNEWFDAWAIKFDEEAALYRKAKTGKGSKAALKRFRDETGFSFPQSDQDVQADALNDLWAIFNKQKKGLYSYQFRTRNTDDNLIAEIDYVKPASNDKRGLLVKHVYGLFPNGTSSRRVFSVSKDQPRQNHEIRDNYNNTASIQDVSVPESRIPTSLPIQAITMESNLTSKSFQTSSGFITSTISATYSSVPSNSSFVTERLNRTTMGSIIDLTKTESSTSETIDASTSLSASTDGNNTSIIPIPMLTDTSMETAASTSDQDRDTTLTSKASSSTDKSVSGSLQTSSISSVSSAINGSYITLSDVWEVSSPVITCTSIPCLVVLPPYTLPTPTTIIRDPVTEDDKTVTFPPFTTDRVEWSRITIDDLSETVDPTMSIEDPFDTGKINPPITIDLPSLPHIHVVGAKPTATPSATPKLSSTPTSTKPPDKTEEATSTIDATTESIQTSAIPTETASITPVPPPADEDQGDEDGGDEDGGDEDEEEEDEEEEEEEGEDCVVPGWDVSDFPIGGDTSDNDLGQDSAATSLESSVASTTSTDAAATTTKMSSTMSTEASMTTSIGTATCNSAPVATETDGTYEVSIEFAVEAVNDFCKSMQSQGKVFSPGQNTSSGDLYFPNGQSGAIRSGNPIQLSAQWNDDDDNGCPTLDFSKFDAMDTCRTILGSIYSSCSNTFINVPVTWGGTLYQDCIQWELQPVEDHTSLDG